MAVRAHFQGGIVITSGTSDPREICFWSVTKQQIPRRARSVAGAGAPAERRICAWRGGRGDLPRVSS